MNKTRELTEAGIMTAILVVFTICATYIPIFRVLLILLVPLPIVILSIRNTKTNVVIATVIATIISSMIVGIIFGLSITAIAFLVGFPIGLSIKNFEQALKTIFFGSLGMIIAIGLIIAMNFLFLGVSFDSIQDQMNTELEVMQAELDAKLNSPSAVALTPEQKEKLTESKIYMESMVNLLIMLFPAAMVMSAAIQSAMVYMLAIQVLKRLKITHRPLGSFKTFGYPKHLAYGSAAMLLGAYALGRMGIVDEIAVMNNFFMLFLMVFLVQGLAVGYFFLTKKFSKKISIVILVAFSILGFTYYLSMVGYMDVMMDIRKIQPKKR